MSATTIADTIKTGHFSRRRKTSEIVVLARSAEVATAPSNNTNENALATITVPANAMGANGFVRVYAVFSFTGSTNQKSLRVRFGGASGTVMFQTDQTTAANTIYTIETIIQNRNATNSQVSRGNSQYGAGVVNAATASVDTTADTSIVLSGQKATGSETLALQQYVVELHYGR